MNKNVYICCFKNYMKEVLQQKWVASNCYGTWSVNCRPLFGTILHTHSQDIWNHRQWTGVDFHNSVRHLRLKCSTCTRPSLTYYSEMTVAKDTQVLSVTAFWLRTCTCTQQLARSKQHTPQADCLSYRLSITALNKSTSAKFMYKVTENRRWSIEPHYY